MKCKNCGHEIYCDKDTGEAIPINAWGEKTQYRHIRNFLSPNIKGKFVFMCETCGCTDAEPKRDV